MTNIPKKVSERQLAWRLRNSPSPVLCVVHTCSGLPLSATQPFCASHQEFIDALGKKNKPSTAAYRRNVWSLIVSGNES